MSPATHFTWAALVPFAAKQTVSVEIRKFVLSIKGNGRVTTLTAETLGIHMHVPPQLGIDEMSLDLSLTYHGAEAGNGFRFDTTRKGQTHRTRHDDVRMTVSDPTRIRVERKAADRDEKDMAFTLARSAAGLVIADILGFGLLDGATITLRAG